MYTTPTFIKDLYLCTTIFKVKVKELAYLVIWTKIALVGFTTIPRACAANFLPN